MTSSVIVKHYKKQLIYRQSEETYVGGNNGCSEEEKGGTTVKKKKKMKGGRGMDMVKLGTAPSGPAPSVIQSAPRRILPQMVANREPRIHPYLPIRPVPRRRGEERIVAAIDLTMEGENSPQRCQCDKRDQTKTKMPQLFLIKNLLNNGSSPKDHSVGTLIGKNRRQSVDIDAFSVSSSGSDSVKSPKPIRLANYDKQIPQGKLCYDREDHCFIRYFDADQRKLFYDSISTDRHYGRSEDRELFRIPKTVSFSLKDNLTVEEYVREMTLVENCAPRDFFLFYKFVTGYQICNNNLPVSFLTFLKVYNTNGLKVLLERYVCSLKE